MIYITLHSKFSVLLSAINLPNFILKTFRSLYFSFNYQILDSDTTHLLNFLKHVISIPKLNHPRKKNSFLVNFINRNLDIYMYNKQAKNLRCLSQLAMVQVQSITRLRLLILFSKIKNNNNNNNNKTLISSIK